MEYGILFFKNEGEEEEKIRKMYDLIIIISIEWSKINSEMLMRRISHHCTQFDVTIIIGEKKTSINLIWINVMCTLGEWFELMALSIETLTIKSNFFIFRQLSLRSYTHYSINIESKKRGRKLESIQIIHLICCSEMKKKEKKN